MDEYTNNRFGYIRELDDNSLLNKKKEVMSEIEYLLALLDNPRTSSEQKSEISNSDLKYERDRLEYIESQIKERNLEEVSTLK